MYLTGKTAVITGVSKGIGRAMAEGLLERGVTVIAWGRNEPPYAHDNLHFIACDVSQEKEVEAAAQKTLELAEQVHFVINNAGFGLFEATDKLSVETWQNMIGVNLTGTFLVTRSLLRHLKDHKFGHIVNICSIAGKQGFMGGQAYTASKFGMNGFGKSLLMEVRKHGIKVTMIYPGSVNTNFFDKVESVNANESMMSPKDIAHTVIHTLDTHPNYMIHEVEMRPLNVTY